MTFELALIDHHHLIDEWVSDEFVLTCRCLPRASFHELSSTYIDIPAILYKNSIGLDKLLVVKEEISLESMSNGTNCVPLGTTAYFNHTVQT